MKVKDAISDNKRLEAQLEGEFNDNLLDDDSSSAEEVLTLHKNENYCNTKTK